MVEAFSLGEEEAIPHFVHIGDETKNDGNPGRVSIVLFRTNILLSHHQTLRIWLISGYAFGTNRSIGLERLRLGLLYGNLWVG